MLTNVIEEKELSNNVLLNEFLKLGISTLDANQTNQFNSLLNEQSKLIARGIAGIETLKLLVTTHFELRKYEKALLIHKQVVTKEELFRLIMISYAFVID